MRKTSQFRLAIEEHMRKSSMVTNEQVTTELWRLLAINRSVRSLAKSLGIEYNPNQHQQLKDYVKEVTGYEYDSENFVYYMPNKQ